MQTWMPIYGFIRALNPTLVIFATRVFHKKATWKNIDAFTRVNVHLFVTNVARALSEGQKWPYITVSYTQGRDRTNVLIVQRVSKEEI